MLDGSATSWLTTRYLLPRRGCGAYKVHNGYWFFGRPPNEELRKDPRAVLEKTHCDGLGRTDVREAWERGELKRFYPPEFGWTH